MFDSILVTGGAGFIGQNFVHYLCRQPDMGRAKIVVLDNLTYAANPSSLDQLIADRRVELVCGNVGDRELVGKLFGDRAFDAVVHFAAESHVDRSISGPDCFVETNILGTYNLLKCALESWQTRRLLGSARFLHISTDEVFGDLEPDDPAFCERSPYRPSSPYSASKAASDHLVRAYHRTFGLPAIVTNCSNNYGPFQYPEKLIPLMIIHALNGKPLPIYGDGANVRDWLYVEDHCRALHAALVRAEPGASYTIGGASERTNRAVVEFLCDEIDRRVSGGDLARQYPQCPASSGRSCRELIDFVTDRVGHDRRYAVNGELIRRELQFEPSVSFETGLARTVDWYLNNEAWWRRALSAGFASWVEQNYGHRKSSVGKLLPA